jgi:hypothetical protein
MYCFLFTLKGNNDFTSGNILRKFFHLNAWHIYSETSVNYKLINKFLLIYFHSSFWYRLLRDGYTWGMVPSGKIIFPLSKLMKINVSFNLLQLLRIHRFMASKTHILCLKYSKILHKIEQYNALSKYFTSLQKIIVSMSRQETCRRWWETQRLSVEQ